MFLLGLFSPHLQPPKEERAILLNGSEGVPLESILLDESPSFEEKLATLEHYLKDNFAKSGLEFPIDFGSSLANKKAKFDSLIKKEQPFSEEDSFQYQALVKLEAELLQFSDVELNQFAEDIAPLHQHQIAVKPEEILDTLLMVNEIRRQSVQGKKPTWEEIQELNYSIERLKDEFEAIISKTVFWRCSLKDLNPELPDEPADITLGIIDEEFYLFVSTEKLRPIPFTKLQTGAAIAAMGAATLASYALSGRGLLPRHWLPPLELSCSPC